jgi:phenylalanyl-tRNA synthetase beta chain
MLVQMHWLKDYVDVPWSAYELAERLTASGSEVERIQRFGADVSGVVAGRIQDVRKHPHADKLVVCDVNIGDRMITVVTGAPNVAVGQVVPVALPGASLVGFDKPLEAGEIRGVESYGMLCAEDELGVGEDHEGIMILPDDTPVGSDLTQLMQLGDAVIEFEIYPNRPDCLSIIGIAREVAALTQGELRIPQPAIAEVGAPADQIAKVIVEAPDLCPRYCARVIRDVKIGPSPLWMQQRLRAAGMRPINNVVDITNYVMLELGQPLHAFDLSLLREQTIIVRRARDGECMRTLDGEERRLDPDMLVIADKEQPVAIAGVMGGENSEITPNTVDLLLESACFDPITVRKTSRRLGLRTEASARFEKGLDPHLPLLAANRAAELLARFCAGKVAPGVIDVHQELPQQRVITIRPERVNQLLGTQLAVDEMIQCLESLGCRVEATESSEAGLSVAVPHHRRDIEREVDLIEEVGRIYGFDNIPATLPQGTATRGGESRESLLVAKVRNACVAAGLHETITYSFTSPRHFDLMRFPADDARRRAINLANPLSPELSVMRTTLLPNLIDGVSRNVTHQVMNVHLFEIGAIFIPKQWPITEQPEERRTLGVALLGTVPQAQGLNAQVCDFFTLKGILEQVGRALNLQFRVEHGNHPSLHPGRTGAIWLEQKEVGVLGEVHPLVMEAYDLPGRAYLMELDLDAVLPAAGKQPVYESLPKYPASTRDLALLVPLNVSAAEVEEQMRKHAGDYLESMELFDVYQGKQVPAGYRSLAYSLTYRAGDRTLTDAEINSSIKLIAEALAAQQIQLRR